jgi:methenyltetrahydrofolate cyclohydrolase
MAQLLDRRLCDLLEDVAEATPAPGGGSSAALTCALAAGLVQMVAGLTLRRGGAAAAGLEPVQRLHDRAGALRGHAGELAQLELHAYAPVLEALRRPADDPARALQVDAALSDAAESPLAIARAAAEVAELAAEAVRLGPEPLRGDAIAGVLLAEAAVAAAGKLVAINLAARSHDERLQELERLTRGAAQARADVLP